MPYERCDRDGVHEPHEYDRGSPDHIRTVMCQGRTKPYRRLGSIAWAVRTDIRHTLNGLGSEIEQLRYDMAAEHLNADGAVTDVDHMMARLRHVRRQLADGHDIPGQGEN